MELHPTDSNLLLTSSTNESKLWNCSTNNVQSHKLDHANIGKFSFSSTGDIFVGLNYPSVNRTETGIKLWQISSLGNAQELRYGPSSDFIDFCWQKSSSQSHYLFTLSKHNTIAKHSIVPSNIRTETPTLFEPTTQTVEDEHLDQLVLTNPVKNKPSVGQRQTKPNDPKQTAHSKNSFVLDSNIKSWNCWLLAPSSQQSNEMADLLFELNSVRKLGVLGLCCNEVFYFTYYFYH
jgi:hypothetical protein